MSRREGRRGLALVEMALVISLLVLLIMGLLEYGWIFIKEHQATQAARRGARVAVLPFTTNDEVLAAIHEVMVAADMGDSGYTVTLTPSDVTLPFPSDILTVEVTVPYENVALTHVPFVPVPTQLHGAVSMAKEGP